MPTLARPAAPLAPASAPSASLATSDGVSLAARRARDRSRTTRSAVDQVLALAEHLAPTDRDLIRSVFDRGLSVAELARAARIPSRRLRRRLQRVVGRLRSTEFAFVVAHGATWPPLRRRIAEQIFLHDEHRSAAALMLGVSTYRIRREVEAVHVLIEQARMMGRLP